MRPKFKFLIHSYLTYSSSLIGLNLRCTSFLPLFHCGMSSIHPLVIIGIKNCSLDFSLFSTIFWLIIFLSSMKIFNLSSNCGKISIIEFLWFNFSSVSWNNPLSYSLTDLSHLILFLMFILNFYIVRWSKCLIIVI